MEVLKGEKVKPSERERKQVYIYPCSLFTSISIYIWIEVKRAREMERKRAKVAWILVFVKRRCFTVQPLSAAGTANGPIPAIMSTRVSEGLNISTSLF